MKLSHDMSMVWAEYAAGEHTINDDCRCRPAVEPINAHDGICYHLPRGTHSEAEQ